MTDAALRLAKLGEMSSIRFQLTELQAPRPSFREIRRYVAHLQKRLAVLEQELREYERVLAVRVILRRPGCRSHYSARDKFGERNPECNQVDSSRIVSLLALVTLKVQED